MSYSIQEAKGERETDIHLALNEEDATKLYEIAEIIKREGDDEKAEQLKKIANRIRGEEWAYDEWVDNNLE